jgi:hypothetical protein
MRPRQCDPAETLYFVADRHYSILQRAMGMDGSRAGRFESRSPGSVHLDDVKVVKHLNRYGVPITWVGRGCNEAVIYDGSWCSRVHHTAMAKVGLFQLRYMRVLPLPHSPHGHVQVSCAFLTPDAYANATHDRYLRGCDAFVHGTAPELQDDDGDVVLHDSNRSLEQWGDPFNIWGIVSMGLRERDW